MPKVKYLDLTKGGNFRFRRRVPPAPTTRPPLQQILRQTEISISLGAKGPRAAERRIRKVADKVEETFEQARKRR